MTTSPVTQSERFYSMDLIRGVAILGILVMNISTFADVNSFYMNPYVYGEPSDANLTTWLLTHFFADQKFYTIFSMLFGAGIMLMAQRASSKGTAPGPLHYRRMGILLVFGLLHGFLVWYGDILTTYALMGMWVYLFALSSQAKTKLYVGAGLVALFFLVMYGFSFLFQLVPEADSKEMIEGFYPSQAMIDDEVAAYKGGWFDNLAHRAKFYGLALANMLTLVGPMRIGGAMLIGMALYQNGVLTAQKDTGFYLKFTLIMALFGIGLQWFDYYVLVQGNFSFEALWLSFGSINSAAAVFIALAYIGLLCLWVKSDALAWFRRKFEAVGQMAFSNYIMQSLICTTLFYGFGLGWFAELERYELYYVVASIFVAQLVWSELWLKKFYFGPLEWLWRSLTYGKAQPFSRAHS